MPKLNFKANNLFISSTLALLSYLPFAVVSKTCFFLLLTVFILDPFENSRVFVLISTFLLLQITKLHRTAEANLAAAHQAE